MLILSRKKLIIYILTLSPWYYLRLLLDNMNKCNIVHIWFQANKVILILGDYEFSGADTLIWVFLSGYLRRTCMTSINLWGWRKENKKERGYNEYHGGENYMW